MDNEKTFKTKTGFCHILPDRIVLTRNGVIGDIAEMTIGNNVSKILIIYGCLSVGLLYFAFYIYKNEQIVPSIFLSLFAIYLAFGVLTSINNSATPIIYRNKIREVKLKKAIAGLTRSRFEVFFEDENKKIRKRLIMLPGSLTDGQSETEKAIKIMTGEKLITQS